MKRVRVLFFIFLHCSTVNATQLMLSAKDDMHFGVLCIFRDGYWTPKSNEQFLVSFPQDKERNQKRELGNNVVPMFCGQNAVEKLIEFYRKWKGDRKVSALLPFMMFPSSVLDKTPYASCVEENNATKLAILLSADLGNMEAQVLSLDILFALTTEDGTKDKIEAHKHSLQKRLSKIDPNNIDNYDLLGLSTLPVVGLSREVVMQNVETFERHYETHKENINARTFLRISDVKLQANRAREAEKYLQLAANKGSARAVITMTHLIAHRSENRENRFPDIQSLLEKYKGYLGGYEHLLPAYYYQYGSLDLVTRNLQTANQKYKAAISKNCREAAFEYGEFLMSMLNTCSEKDLGKTEFHTQAIIAYEKAGDLGLEAGYSKAIALFSKPKMDNDSIQKQDEIKKKLEDSKIFFHSLDESRASNYEAVDKKRRTEAVDRPKFMDTILSKILDGFN